MRTLRFVILVFALAAPAATANHWIVSFEANEDGRGDLEARGQSNCVAEAIASVGSAKCPVEAQGVLVLDSFAIQRFPAQHGFSPTPEGSEQAVGTNYYNHRASLLTFGNTRRDGGGGPDVLLPGLLTYHAWLGRWADANGDGVLDLRVGWEANGVVKDLPGTEWAPLRSADAPRPMAYVSPGAHPVAIAAYRPGELEPDFEYGFANTAYRTWFAGDSSPGRTSMVYGDGSLLESYTVETATNLILVPGHVPGIGFRPYTTTAESLVDIDLYAAVAIGSVGELYKASGFDEFVHHSPGLSSCPEGCAPPTFPAPGFLSRYPQETEADALGSAAGRLPHYTDGFGAWLDVQGLLADPDASTLAANPRPRPLFALGAGGAAALAPGSLFVVDVWTGLWRDASGDGFIGDVGDDAYEGGTRAIGDRYHASAGEFIPQPGREAMPGGKFNVTLVPDQDWGPLGVWLLDRDSNGALWASQYYWAVARGETPPHAGVFWTGSAPIVLDLESYNAEPGHWTSFLGVFFPDGTRHGGFSLCTGARDFDLPSGAEGAWDCDRVEALDVA